MAETDATTDRLQKALQAHLDSRTLPGQQATASKDEASPALEMREFSRVNRARCESRAGFNHALHSWSLSDWFTATVGELGEAANIAKKLNRVRDGIRGNTETPDQLRDKLARELADTFIYLDLLAQSAGVDLPAAIVQVFNAKSDQLGCSIRIVSPEAREAGRPETTPTSPDGEIQRRLDRAEASLRETQQALEQVKGYAQHKPRCPILNWNNGVMAIFRDGGAEWAEVPKPACTCGLTDRLAALSPTTPEAPTEEQ